MHWSILGAPMCALRSQSGHPTGPYWSILGGHKATWVKRSQARCCTGCYWFILGGHKATRVKRSRARCCTGSYWFIVGGCKATWVKSSQSCCRTGPYRSILGRPCGGRDPGWDAILVHTGKATIPVGMPYRSVPLRPKAWGSQVGPQSHTGPYSSGPRQHRSHFPTGIQWCFILVYTGMPQDERRSPGGRHWAVLVHTGGAVEPLWGSLRGL